MLRLYGKHTFRCGLSFRVGACALGVLQCFSVPDGGIGNSGCSSPGGGVVPWGVVCCDDSCVASSDSGLTLTLGCGDSHPSPSKGCDGVAKRKSGSSLITCGRRCLLLDLCTFFGEHALIVSVGLGFFTLLLRCLLVGDGVPDGGVAPWDVVCCDVSCVANSNSGLEGEPKDSSTLCCCGVASSGRSS